MQDNPSKESIRREKLQKAARDTEREEKAIFDMLNTPQGKEAYPLLRALFYDNQVHVPGDPYSTAFRAGQRDVIRRFRLCIKNFTEGVDGDVDI